MVLGYIMTSYLTEKHKHNTICIHVICNARQNYKKKVAPTSIDPLNYNSIIDCFYSIQRFCK